MTTTGPGRAARIVLLIVRSAVLLAVVGGIVWFVNVLDDPRRQVATSTSDYADLCAGRPIPESAAYVPGPGKHPVVVFGNRQDETGDTGSEVRFGDGIDREAYPLNPETVQLVACAERTDDGPQVGSCTYQFERDPAPMHRSTVEITVYQARTGEQVGEPVTLVADDTTCPFSILYEGDPIVYSKPTAEQLHTVLAPLVGA